MAQRDRGRYLTDAGLVRLGGAIAAWEERHGRKCTQEKLKDLSKLDIKTIANIRKCKAGVDVDSLQRLFIGLDLILVETDHHIPVPAKSEVKSDRGFFGRDQAIDDLNCLVGQNYRIIVIQAKGGVGKTVLARQYLKMQGFDQVLELWMAKETQNIVSVESVIEEWLRRGFNEEPGREFGVSLERLRKKLRDPVLRIGVLIDNLEPALDVEGKFIEEHRRYVELLRVLGDREVKSLTLITSRERLREAALSVQPYLLSSLDQEAWFSYFDVRQVQAHKNALTEIHCAYGGNAKAMEILCSAILQDYRGDLEAYWEENQDDLLSERDLEDLVVGQFDRLQGQDPEAYKLLCRMGCYRYQNVPTVSLDGLLCLLWDVPKREQKRVVKRLQERSLIEYEENEFWLHPIIREKAIDQLGQGQDWHISNYNAAMFWLNLIQQPKDLNEILVNLEPFYHYIVIGEHKRASKIVYDPDNLPSLLGTMRGLGLYSKCIEILKILDAYPNTQDVTYFVNGMLGDFYSIVGNTKLAFVNYEKAIELNRKDIRRYCDCLLAMALLYLKTRKIKEASELCEQVSSFDSQLFFERDASFSFDYDDQCAQAILVSSYCFLSYIYHLMEVPNQSKSYLELAIALQSDLRHTGGSWWPMYGNYYLSKSLCEHGRLDEAEEVANFLLEISKNLSYPLFGAIGLSLIGEIFVRKGMVYKGIEKMARSREILEEIGAKFEVAQVSYQLGLAYLLLNDTEKSKINVKEAIRLFEILEAPNQVEYLQRIFFALLET
jgi:tetratricopeptide (TPR) repeat protein/transcriptional regulator with XRE-family HTH domain